MNQRDLMSSSAGPSLVERLLAVATTGLPEMVRTDNLCVHTVRGTATSDGPRVVAEGQSIRYTAITALGTNLLAEEQQRAALRGRTAAELAGAAAREALSSPDPGASALAAWAQAEVSGVVDQSLFRRLEDWMSGPLPTVDLSWMVCAALAAVSVGDGTAGDAAGELLTPAADRLRAAQQPSGLFPHVLGEQGRPGLRGHVSCFADAVYPIQALTRLALQGDHRWALDAANRCADQIVRVQGGAGQWWWHYDVRTGSVLEGYPVYSVHQHAMGPMCLLELAAAGGHDHTGAVDSGLRWLLTHPEVFSELIDDERGVVWRKVARREPSKAARRVAALAALIRPGLRVPGIDRVFPPGDIDFECRPYEFGWMLYAWLHPLPRRQAVAGEESR